MSFAFVFPGQGSQSVGMMAAYGDAAVVRATFDEASSVLGDDLWAMVADGPAEVLTQTVNTQPVMLTAGVAVWRLWQEMGGRNPSILAGHSLGEYSALVAAGVIDFKDAVPLVRLLHGCHTWSGYTKPHRRLCRLRTGRNCRAG